MKQDKLLLFLFLCISLIAKAAPGDKNEFLLPLFALSAEGLNFSGTTPEDRVIALCQQAEQVALQSQDYNSLFKIEQITINSYCLKGDIGLALNKAQQMFEEAKRYQSDIGMALAFQAIGNTYMHSNQSTQAEAAFADAEKHLKETDEDLFKLRLMIQQMQVCVNLKKMDNLQTHLIAAGKLLDHSVALSHELTDKKFYVFYLHYYRTLYYIGIKDVELARLTLEQVSQPQFTNSKKFNHGRYYLTACYHDLKGDYAHALLYCDSTLTEAGTNGNINEYKNLLTEKALLLEKNGLKEEACHLYIRASRLSDSLNRQRYSSQIDSLHIAYWVDQIALETTTANNKLLTNVLLSTMLLLVLVLLVLFLIRRKNKQLQLSHSQLSNMRQEATDSYQTKSLFLSNMSHELRTPLNAIVGFSQLLGAEENIDDETREQCGVLIQQNADLLIKLFNDVADFSALRDNTIRFTFQQCNVVELCQNVINTVEKVKRTEAQVRFVSTIDSLMINTDSGRLQQVLINLLINATKFTSEGMITLRFEVDASKKEALFSVEDTGCGIPLAKQPYIFERFEKLHEGVQGAGLGLSICQLIIGYVGGRIWIDSDYTQGARFVFTHPLNAKPPTHTPIQS